MIHDTIIIEGRYQLTNRWFIELPGTFNLRIDEPGGRTISRPGLGFQVSVWDNIHRTSIEERVAQVTDNIAANAPNVFNRQEMREEQVTKLSFQEDIQDNNVKIHVFTCFIIDGDGQIELCFNFYDEAEFETANAIWQSLREEGQPGSDPIMHVFSCDIDAEVDRFFDDSSIPHDEKPKIVILTGGCASGKTTLRKEQYATGYVIVDAAEIFLSLSRGEFFPFPDGLEKPMNMIGERVAHRAVVERRHIVTELIFFDLEGVTNITHALRAFGYTMTMVQVQCDPEVAWERNVNRGDDNISCVVTERYQIRWLLKAVPEVSKPEKEEI